MGYQKEIFISAVNKVFICAFCNEIVKYPKECQRCSNLICAECTVQILKKDLNAKCPSCEEQLQVKQANKNVRRLLGAFRVNCKACSWSGSLENFEKHEQNEHTKDSPSSLENTSSIEKKVSKWSLLPSSSSIEIESTEKFEEQRRKRKEKLSKTLESNGTQQQSNNLFDVWHQEQKNNKKLDNLLESTWQSHLQLFNYSLAFSKTSKHKSVKINNYRAIFPPLENRNQFRVCVFPPKISIGPIYTWSFKIIRGLEWIIGICNKQTMENVNYQLQEHLFHNFSYGWNTEKAQLITNQDKKDYGLPIEEGDLVSIQVDSKNGRISFGVNEIFYGVAYEDQVFQMVERWPAIAGKEGEIEVIQWPN